MIHGPQHEALVAAVREQVPTSAGVYLLRGHGGEVLYVGKAVNLRRRLLNHLTSDPGTAEPRHGRLVHEIRGFDHRPTASELRALLLEDDLIKRHRPRYNVRQKDYLEYKYLELTADAHPRLAMVDHADDFGARRVFGPYRDRFLVDRIVQEIHQHLGLRSCLDPDPRGPCLAFDLGRCAGPCRGGAGAAGHARAVERAVAFLEGDVSEVVSRLERAMAQAAEGEAFEKARLLSERSDFCRRFGERQRFLRAFKAGRLTIVEKGEPGRTHVFVRGRLAGGAIGDGRDSGRVAEADPREWPALAAGDDARFLFDRAMVVFGWLRRRAGACAYGFEDV